MNGIGMILVAAFAAGVVQALTGFGAGIVMMIVLPLLYAIPQAAGISQAICLAICAMMTFQYRKSIQWKKALKPVVPYLTVSSLCIQFSTRVNQEILVRIFGGFLVLLSLYYLFFNKNAGPKEMSRPMSALYIVASGLWDGLFGIGGPLMVIYFLNLTKDKKEYLGTMQAFSILNVLWNTLFRLYSGILTTAHLPMIAAGMAAILIASVLAKKAVEKIDDAKLRKMTYLLIGISGLLNVL